MTQTETKPPTKALAKVNVNPKAPIKSVNTFKHFLEQPAIFAMVQRAATKHLTMERLSSMVYTAISRTPQLLQCTPMSLLNGTIDAALAGCVAIGGPMARGYLIPYKNGRLSREAGEDVYEAQFMSSYLGLCDMARRSGEIAFVDAFAVFEGDQFDYDQGFSSKLLHKPSPDPKAVRTKATLRFVYAIARYRTHDLPQFRVLTLGEVEEHRARSRAKDNGPWVTDYIAMAMKTAVRVLAKWLPQSAEMIENEAREAQIEMIDAHSIALPDLGRMDRTEALADRLGTAEGETVNEVTGEVLPTEEPDPATKAEAARQVEALKDAEQAPAPTTPEEAPE